MYSHMVYDIVAGEHIAVERPDILIIEGLNVLQPARVEADGKPGLAVSDFFDFSVFVDAPESHIRQWFLERFLTLRRTAFTDERSFFRRYAELSEADAVAFGARGLGGDQRPQPAPQHRAHQGSGHGHPRQARVARSRLDPHPQGVTAQRSPPGVDVKKRAFIMYGFRRVWNRGISRTT